jgi:hypothetical protein
MIGGVAGSAGFSVAAGGVASGLLASAVGVDAGVALEAATMLGCKVGSAVAAVRGNKWRLNKEPFQLAAGIARAIATPTAAAAGARRPSARRPRRRRAGSQSRCRWQRAHHISMA